jgi:hypothetical protein
MRMSVRQILVVLSVAAGAVATGLTFGAGPPVLGAPVPEALSGLAAPQAVPGVVLGGVRAERFGSWFDACDPPPCTLGDDLCREAAYAAVMECVRAGALGPRPDAQATLFRASGGGVTLYGSVGPVAAPQRELLTDVARRVEE